MPVRGGERRATPRAAGRQIAPTLARLGNAGQAMGTGSPAISRMRLSPSAMAGRYCCAMMVRLPWRVSVSTITLRFRVACADLNTEAPPMPSRGFGTASPIRR